MNDLSLPRERYYNINDLKQHRYFRHVVDILKNHPYEKELIAIHAAVLVDGARIISVGYNQPWRPKFVRQLRNAHENLSLHAEMNCLNESKKRDLRGTKMYVVRVFKNHETIAISRPCHYCQEAMDCAGIKRAIYTTNNGFLGDMKIKAPYIKMSAESL